MKIGYCYGRYKWSKLTPKQGQEAWSMLMNLNGEAKKYKVRGKPYDNRDATIAKRLGLKAIYVRQFLCIKSVEHLNKINERINKL